MEKLSLDIDTKIKIMKLHSLNAEEWFVIELLFLAQEGHTDHLVEYFNECVKSTLPRDTLRSLKDKGVFDKSYDVPGEGEEFDFEEVIFSPLFIRNYFRNSFQLGKELFDSYPPFIQGTDMMLPARNVTKSGFQDETDLFIKYAKKIRYNLKKHNEVLDVLAWARQYELLQYGICEYIATSKWEEHTELRNTGTVGSHTFKVSTLEDI